MGSIKPGNPVSASKTRHLKQARPKRYTIARNGEDRSPEECTGARGHGHFMSQCLAGGTGSARMRTFRITLDGKPEKKSLTKHPGEEFILVQEGAVRIIIGKNEETLFEGDSIYYRSTIPHRIENIEGWHTVILAVICC